jgi:hypothetical protein
MHTHTPLTNAERAAMWRRAAEQHATRARQLRARGSIMRAREADRLRADCERRARALDATTDITSTTAEESA